MKRPGDGSCKALCVIFFMLNKNKAFLDRLFLLNFCLKSSKICSLLFVRGQLSPKKCGPRNMCTGEVRQKKRAPALPAMPLVTWCEFEWTISFLFKLWRNQSSVNSLYNKGCFSICAWLKYFSFTRNSKVNHVFLLIIYIIKL